MGIVKENAEFLCQAARSGVSFRRMLTLGHQSQYLDQAFIADLAARHGIAACPDDLHRDTYADRFFRIFLGAETVVALDASAYEAAGLIHDLNLPLPAEHEQQFDVVFDGGALEHVFNFPVAVASCMRALAVGGSFVSSTIANNCMGHGFYQFSPELFFRMFSAEFGFRVDDMLALETRHLGGEHGAAGPMYRVADPEALRSRIMVVNARPLSLLVRACKLVHRPQPFANGFPQQSDYAALWQADGPAAAVAVPSTSAPASGSAARRAAKAVFALLPEGTKRWFRLRREERQHSLRNQQHFAPLRPDDDTR